MCQICLSFSKLVQLQQHLSAKKKNAWPTFRRQYVALSNFTFIPTKYAILCSPLHIALKQLYFDAAMKMFFFLLQTKCLTVTAATTTCSCYYRYHFLFLFHFLGCYTVIGPNFQGNFDLSSAACPCQQPACSNTYLYTTRLNCVV